jgi:hypothetical protein
MNWAHHWASDLKKASMGSVVSTGPSKVPTILGKTHPTVANMAERPLANSAARRWSSGAHCAKPRGSNYSIKRQPCEDHPNPRERKMVFSLLSLTFFPPDSRLDPLNPSNPADNLVATGAG